MNKVELLKKAVSFVESSEGNYISKDIAISTKLVGMKIYERPLMGFAAADDDFFYKFKESSIIGEHFGMPRQWLPEAQTIISFFLPFSRTVKLGNRRDKSFPSNEWLHGRIEGQAFLNKLCAYLNSEIIAQGYKSVAPSMDKRFWAKTGPGKDAQPSDLTFTSNWSERHVAFVCGLGTFGLSKGLITPRGVAGRFGSIITDLYLQPSPRVYDTINQYCIMCGTCIKNCPVQAISIEQGKNHQICSDFLDVTREKYKPRYGCGKCQTRVPCEGRIPINKQANRTTLPCSQ